MKVCDLKDWLKEVPEDMDVYLRCPETGEQFKIIDVEKFDNKPGPYSKDEVIVINGYFQ